MWNVKEAVAHRALADRPRQRPPGAARRPGGVGQGTGRGAHRRAWPSPATTSSATSDDLRPAARRRAPAPAAGPAGRAGARRRGRRGRRAGGQPVPQDVPGGQRRRPGAAGARAGRPGRVGGRASPRLKRTVRELSSRYPRGAPAARPGLAGAGADPDAGQPVPTDRPDTGTAAEPAPRVVAVVVTYNRRDLLLESLAAVLGADRRAGRGDRGGQRLRPTAPPPRCGRSFPAVRLAELTRNTGGAGGFAYGHGAGPGRRRRPVWLMDDDTVPEPGALARAARRAGPATRAGRPALVASRVSGPTGATTR